MEILKRSSFIQHGDTTGTMEECETKEQIFLSSHDSTANDGDEESFSSEAVGDECFVEETLSNSDNLEVESGVELSATGDVTEAELLDELSFPSEFAGEDFYLQLGDLDLTTEQAQETLKYFSEYCFFSLFTVV